MKEMGRFHRRCHRTESVRPRLQAAHSKAKPALPLPELRGGIKYPAPGCFRYRQPSGIVLSGILRAAVQAGGNRGIVCLTPE